MCNCNCNCNPSTAGHIVWTSIRHGTALKVLHTGDAKSNNDRLFNLYVDDGLCFYINTHISYIYIILYYVVLYCVVVCYIIYIITVFSPRTSVVTSAGPCSLQWLHATNQLASQPSRAASITDNHTKQAKRLLRLFRHALATSQPQPGMPMTQPGNSLLPAAARSQSSEPAVQSGNDLVPTTHRPRPSSLVLTPAHSSQSITQGSQPTVPTVQPNSNPMPTAEHSQPTRSEGFTTEQQAHSSASAPCSRPSASESLHSPTLNPNAPKATLSARMADQGLPDIQLQSQQRQRHHSEGAATRQGMPDAQPQSQQRPQQPQECQSEAVAQVAAGRGSTTYLVETCIPWETLPLSSCYAPCPFHFSFTAAAALQSWMDQDSAAHDSATQDAAAQDSAAQDSAAQGSAAQHSSAPTSACQCSDAHRSNARSSPARPSQDANQTATAHQGIIQEHPAQSATGQHSAAVQSAIQLQADGTPAAADGNAGLHVPAAEQAIRHAVQQALQGQTGVHELQFTGIVKVSAEDSLEYCGSCYNIET